MTLTTYCFCSLLGGSKLRKERICSPVSSFILKTELKIRRGSGDNSKTIFLISQNIHCDSSLESSRQDGSNEGSQCIFFFQHHHHQIFY